MGIKKKRVELREIDRQIIDLMRTRFEFSSELDEAIKKELGVDPMSSADNDVLLLKRYAESRNFDPDIASMIGDFLIHYVR